MDTPSPTIRINRRDAQSFNCTFTALDINGVSQPFNLTGYTVMFTVKRNPADADTSALIPTIRVTTHTNPTQGLTTVSITSTQTDITEGVYHYDFQLSIGGVPQSTRSGVFIVDQDITGAVS